VSRSNPAECSRRRSQAPGQKGLDMKKILNGLLYNTDSAKLIAEWSCNLSRSDFGYCEEELYLKKTGEYFLYGSGNAASKYAESCGNNTWGSGSEIIPLSPEAAREWAEEKLDADEYESIFGAVSEDGADVAVSFRLSPDVAAAIVNAARSEKISQKAVVERLVKENLMRNYE
jgi:hypothetical protein